MSCVTLAFTTRARACPRSCSRSPHCYSTPSHAGVRACDPCLVSVPCAPAWDTVRTASTTAARTIPLDNHSSGNSQSSSHSHGLEVTTRTPVTIETKHRQRETQGLIDSCLSRVRAWSTDGSYSSAGLSRMTSCPSQLQLPSTQLYEVGSYRHLTQSLLRSYIPVHPPSPHTQTASVPTHMPMHTVCPTQPTGCCVRTSISG